MAGASPHVAAVIRLIGLPTDSHSSFLRGPAQAPAAIRAALASDHANQATELGPELGADIVVEDVGDLLLDESPDDFERIRTAASAAVKSGAIPISLGGDHMVTFPIVTGITDVRGQVHILHLDAHPDIYDNYQGNRIIATHPTMFGADENGNPLDPNPEVGPRHAQDVRDAISRTLVTSPEELMLNWRTTPPMSAEFFEVSWR